jgi:hypothetical protein
MKKGITFVTSFIQIYKDSLYLDRDTSYYFSKFIELVKSDIQLCVYIDDSLIEFFKNTTFPNVKVMKVVNIKDTWVYSELHKQISNDGDQNETISLPDVRNYDKDIPEYMMLMNSKIDYVKDAMEQNPFNSTHFAWIDFSISYVFKNLNSSLDLLKFYNTIKLNDKFLCMPGCTDKPPIDDTEALINRVNWRFCGGFFIGDKESLEEFHTFYRLYFPQFLSKYKKIVWEVNFWAWLEAIEPNWNPIWFKADHNDSIIEMPAIYYSISLTEICENRLENSDENSKETCEGQNRVETCEGENRGETCEGENRVETCEGENRVETCEDENRVGTCEGENRVETYEGENRVETYEGENRVETCEGQNDCTYTKIKYDYLNIEGFSPSSASYFSLNVFDKNGNKTDKIKHILNTRYINYKIIEDGIYHFYNHERTIISRNVCSILDDITLLPTCFFTVSEEFIDINKKEDTRIKGLEDIRLFSSTNINYIEGDIIELDFIASSVDYSNQNHNRMVLGKYFINESENQVYLKNCRVIDSPVLGDQSYVCEKNWIPIIGDTKCIYKWSPFEIINIEGETPQPTSIMSIPAVSPICKKFRGSTIFIPTDDDNTLIGVVHFTEGILKTLRYYHCLVLIDKSTMLPKKYSHPFYFENLSIEYCIGFYIKENNYYFWISQMDRDPLLIVVPSSKFLNLFIDYN